MTHEAGTSEANPIRVAWILAADVPAAAGWTGRLGMTFLPGKRDVGLAGIHRRDLGLDVRDLRSVHGAGAFVLLVEDHELAATSTAGIADVMGGQDIELIRFPIVDGGVPAEAPFRTLVHGLLERLRAGQSVVVACRGGLGRTGTTIACLLVEAGLDADSAMALTRARRPGAIETSGQEAFVRRWAAGA
jgi:ADP-ribosyl-[dinitrogen reductase] hydrolase